MHGQEDSAGDSECVKADRQEYGQRQVESAMGNELRLGV